MKEAKRAKPMDAKTVEDAKILAGFGFSPKVIGEKLGYSESTIIKLEHDGYDLDKYLKRKKEQNKKAAEKKMKVELVYDPSIAEEYRREQEAKQAEEQVPGQMKMELEEPPKEMVDRTKFMRFEAGQNDLTRKAIAEAAVMLNTKLDRLNDTLCMILRAVRKE